MIINIILPKTRAYVADYDGQSKWIYFLIKKWWLIEQT